MTKKKRERMKYVYPVTAIVFVVASVLAYMAGYRTAENTWQQTYSRNGAVALSTNLRLLSSLESGKTQEMRQLLHVTIDSNVAQIMAYDDLLSDDKTYQRLRDREITKLKSIWDRQPPFKGKEWDELKNKEEWTQLRRAHDAFIAMTAERAGSKSGKDQDKGRDTN